MWRAKWQCELNPALCIAEEDSFEGCCWCSSDLGFLWRPNIIVYPCSFGPFFGYPSLHDIVGIIYHLIFQYLGINQHTYCPSRAGCGFWYVWMALMWRCASSVSVLAWIWGAHARKHAREATLANGNLPSPLLTRQSNFRTHSLQT